MVFGLFKNYPIFRYIIYDFLKKVSRGSRPTCLAKILCAQVGQSQILSIIYCSKRGTLLPRTPVPERVHRPPGNGHFGKRDNLATRTLALRQLGQHDSLAMDILAARHFGKRHFGSTTFWQHNISATQHCGTSSSFGTTTFRHYDTLALFTFQHYDILARQLLGSSHSDTTTLWQHDILCGVVWCCVVLCGVVWCCVVLCGVV